MSGAGVPYRLRPHKAVDRRLFVDLLSRIERWWPLVDHVYLSMGAHSLEDHRLVHKNIGIKNLITFDADSEVVARQRFNAPTTSCYCHEGLSGEVIAKLDNVLTQYGMSADSGLVVWLDYTAPGQIGSQIREFQHLLDKGKVGDVVRITVNANPSSLGEFRDANDRPLPANELHQRRLGVLRSRIGEYLPASCDAEKLTVEDFPIVLAQSFAAAALKAIPVSSSNVFSPLSLVRYSDGLQMLSITGCIMPKNQVQAVRSKLSLDAWPFSSSDWITIHHLVVPDLTLRERLFLERNINLANDKIISGLGFSKADQVDVSDFIDNYRLYYRFYPMVLSAEI